MNEIMIGGKTYQINIELAIKDGYLVEKKKKKYPTKFGQRIIIHRPLKGEEHIITLIYQGSKKTINLTSLEDGLVWARTCVEVGDPYNITPEEFDSVVVNGFCFCDWHLVE